MLEKPDVDLIEGLSPAISIEQKSTSGNPRSTVGTVTEIYDYLRLLYARLGVVKCHNCGKPVVKQSTSQIIEFVKNNFPGKKITVLAPVIRGRKGHYRELFEEMLDSGFLKARVDGQIVELVQGYQTGRYKLHNIEIVVDKITISDNAVSRLENSIEVALNHGEGSVIIFDESEDHYFSRNLACLECGISYQELAPNSFSFNSMYGICSNCDGLGEISDFDINLMIPDRTKTISEEGILPLGKPRSVWIYSHLEAVSKTYNFDFNTPIEKLPEGILDLIINGSDEKIKFTYSYGDSKPVTYMQKFNGIKTYLKNLNATTTSNKIRDWVSTFTNTVKCPECGGGRIKKESLAVTFSGLNISQVSNLSIDKAKEFFDEVVITGNQGIVAAPILHEIKTRLDFLLNVGLDYLTLSRAARSLSGGEAQRIRLATQIGAQLSGVLYILDEPSIGLHQRDNLKLINSLKMLRDLNNTIIVVEHDKETIENSDYLIDLGPAAGEKGGEICAFGETSSILNNLNGFSSLTIDYLSGKKNIKITSERRKGNGKTLSIIGAKGNNLKNVDLHIPLGTLTVISGVSGSGKSSLINETLVKRLFKHFYDPKTVPLPHKSIEGLENIDKVIEIDQSPIGRTPRSNPATYTGLFTFIRDLFTQLPESKMRGYAVGRFSFNVVGGRCENCDGDGIKKIEMNFLPDVYVKCDVCRGKRYNRETLEVLYKTKSIADVLDMTVDEALEFFADLPRIKRKIQSIHDVGLGYIRLGQQATTLSGGEAQRVKLATELSKIGTGKTIYLLDEPTTGLHFEDVRVLLEALNKLVQKGNTVVIVEHNLDVIKSADWLIDMGPGGGESGGNIVAEGIPEDVVKNPNSVTGIYLLKELNSN